MTDRRTRFDQANLTTEHTPAGGGEESPRSYRRGGGSNGAGSATVPGRIRPMADRTPRFDQANRTSEHAWAGGGEESPRSCTCVGQMALLLRPGRLEVVNFNPGHVHMAVRRLEAKAQVVRCRLKRHWHIG